MVFGSVRVYSGHIRNLRKIWGKRRKGENSSCEIGNEYDFSNLVRML